MSIVDLRADDRQGRVPIDDDRTGLNKEALKRSFLDNLLYVQGKFPTLATRKDYYLALAYVVRDRMLQRWISTAAAYTSSPLTAVSANTARTSGVSNRCRSACLPRTKSGPGFLQ